MAEHTIKDQTKWLEHHKRGVIHLQHPLEYGDAKRCFEQSLKVATDAGSKMGVAASQQALGRIYLDAHEFGQARALLKEALAAFYALGIAKGRVGCMLDIAKIDIFEGLPERIWEAKLSEAKRIALSAGLPTEPIDSWLQLGKRQARLIVVAPEDVRMQIGLK